MRAARWERMQALFYEALEVEASRQRAFLEARCEDPELVADVLALLEADADDHALLDQDLARVARDVLGASPPVPHTVGPYRIQEVLGRGGMGMVYRAEREDLGNQVAIKVLQDASLSAARRERFMREQQALAQLNHPSIARIYDAAFLPDGTPYFVMEYVEGLPLTTYCRKHRCTLSERLELFRAVCEAVQYAHRQAVVHRDLKPSNILVAEHGPGARPAVKLLDFGIAKQLADLKAPAAPTPDAPRLMTPAYAAPEQFRGGPVGVYTDIYALGLILYEFLAGALPFDPAALTPSQIESLKKAQELKKPSVQARRTAERSPDVAPGLTIGKRAWADLEAVCQTALRSDPQQRYPTVDALLLDLDRFLKSEPLSVRPSTLGYRLGKFLRRYRQLVLAAALAGAVIVGLVAFYTVQTTRQRTQAQAEAQKAEQVSDYLIGLFEASDPYAAADSLDARMLLRRGVERAEALSAQPAVQAQMFNTLGRVYMQLSEFDRAGLLLHRALTLRRALGDVPIDVAETLGELGALYARTGEYDRAETFARRALALREAHLSPQHPDLASNLSNLGVILNRQGRYEEAEALYRTALRMQRALQDEPREDLANSLNNLAVNLLDQGKYAPAERYFRQAIAADRAVFGPDHPNTAIDLANLGVLLDTRGHYDAADSMLTEALRIKRQTLGADHYETAFSLTQLGGTLRRKGDYERAEALLREALAIEERVLDPGHRNTAVTLNHLALTLQGQGRYAAAEPLLHRALRIFEESVGAQHPFTATVRCHLAHLLRLRGEPDAAGPLFQAGLSTLRAALPPGHDLVALQEGKYGALLAAQSRFTKAESLLTKSHETLNAQFGPGHPDTHAAARRLVELYEAWGKPEAADPFRAPLDGGKKGVASP